MIRKGSFILAVLVIQFGAIHSSGQCVRDELKVDKFEGKVYVVSRDGNVGDTFPNASLKLARRAPNGDEIVFEVFSNSKGVFGAENIQKGSYILTAYAPNFDKIVTRLRIVKRSRSNKANSLVIGLAPPDYSATDSCEGYAKIKTNS